MIWLWKINFTTLYKGMKPLYNQDEFKKAKYKDVLPLECYCCGKQFWTQKKRIKDVMITACKININNGCWLISNIEVTIYVEIITMPTLIKLIVISKVASNRLGRSRSWITFLYFILLPFCNSLTSVGVNEKKAISEPEINADINNNIIIFFFVVVQQIHT